MKLVTGLLTLIISASAAAEPLQFVAGRLYVSAEVQGVRSEALLDSGAEASLMDPALARLAKIKPGDPITIRGSAGAAQARLASDVTIHVLGQVLKPDAVVILDLKPMSAQLLKRSTRLIVGRDLFDATRLRIDIARQDIRPVDRRSVPAGVRLALTAHAGIASIPVRLRGATYQGEFELGKGTRTMISRALTRTMGLKVLRQERGGGIGGSVVRDIVALPPLEIAGRTITDVEAAVDDQSSSNDLNVGTAILKDFVITTDFAQRAVWLQPSRADR